MIAGCVEWLDDPDQRTGAVTPLTGLHGDDPGDDGGYNDVTRAPRTT